MTPLLAIAVFFAQPSPVEMPRAEAYLVTLSDGTRRAEDRYHRLDLWFSQAVVGRWTDAEGRVFTLADLAVEPPAEISENTVVTRSAYAKQKSLFSLSRNGEVRQSRSFKRALGLLSPVEPVKVAGSSGPPRGYRDVVYWHGTNTSAVVCAYLAEKSPSWRLAVWTLADGDDFASAIETFENGFLRSTDKNLNEVGPYLADAAAGERELWRREVSRAVSRYDGWHVTDLPEYVVLDNLPDGKNFVSSLTNTLEIMRTRYAGVVPAGPETTGYLSVIRIFSTREEYLDTLSTEGLTNMSWSAAYWCQSRRELVAFMPPEGEGALMRTLKHEAFHQYLSFACGMVMPSPWINEGYAEYFEDENADPFAAMPAVADAEALLGSVMAMDYRGFYSGTPEELRLKYLVARSIAYFLENGAGKVRFNPFADVKGRYFNTLGETHDMHRATAEAFGSDGLFALFAAEWLKYKGD